MAGFQVITEAAGDQRETTSVLGSARRLCEIGSRAAANLMDLRACWSRSSIASPRQSNEFWHRGRDYFHPNAGVEKHGHLLNNGTDRLGEFGFQRTQAPSAALAPGIQGAVFGFSAPESKAPENRILCTRFSGRLCRCSRRLHLRRPIPGEETLFQSRRLLSSRGFQREIAHLRRIGSQIE